MIKLDFPSDWAYAWSDTKPTCSGMFRCSPDDFRVDEILGFEPSGDGEHVYLQIEKIGQNTQWLIEEMARQTGVERPLFGYSGIKDRHAVTTQWISFQDPTRAIDPKKLEIPGVQILAAGYNSKKLRPGMHQENKFKLRLCDLTFEREELENTLVAISEKGFPNYFGEQRFGFDGQNLERGWELLQVRRLSKHKKKSIYLSALRSFVFNRVLSERIESKLEPSELLEFDDSGPLWGRGRATVSERQQVFEKKALSDWLPLCEALEYAGLKQERRMLFVTPGSMRWEWEARNQLVLEFSLPPGAYATSLIRELGDLADGSKQLQ